MAVVLGPEPVPDSSSRRPVPWRTIWATIASVLVTLLALLLVRELGRILAFLLVALFLTTVLTPPVDFLVSKLRMRRGLATALVFLAMLGVVALLLYAFIRPLVDQAQQFAEDLPGYVEDAREGRGTVGRLVERYNLQEYVDENQDRLREFVTNLGTPALGVVRQIFTTLFASVTVLVLTILMLMQGPRLSQATLAVIPGRHRNRVRAVAGDAAKAVSGYVFGNLVISVIAGGSAWLMLAITGVPYAGVLALWVAFADLIPLVGATLGAVPAVLVAFLHSVPAGIATVIFFVAYQQFENHVLQVTIMSRTVDVNPLAVLISVLVGVELFGLLGALLAIPGAGVIQVIARDLWDEHRGRLKDEPTVGAAEVPLVEPS